MKPLRMLPIAAALGFALHGAAAASGDAPKEQFAGFAAFAGSESNLQSLVGGLRHDAPVTLSSTVAPGGPQSVTFDPPTRPMGFGNVRRALTLARAELRAAGIANPTPQQIQAAMMGGTVTSADGKAVALKGVLQLRSQGMGWGRIRQALSLPPTTFATSSHAGAGITTAAGPVQPAGLRAHGGEAEAGAHAEAHGHVAAMVPSPHAGIVTAAGVSAGAAASAGHGGGSGRGGR